MADARASFNPVDIDRALDQVLTRLRTPALDDLPQPDRRDLAGNTEQQAVRPLRQALEAEWQRQLGIERGLNSRAPNLDPIVRQYREYDIFAAALHDLLPLRRKLIAIDARLIQLRDQPVEAPLTGTAAVEAGTAALAAANVSEAFSVWAVAGEPAEIAPLVQHQREYTAAHLLQRAHAAVADMKRMDDAQDRAALSATIRKDYVEPARRIGREWQREEAALLADAMQAAVQGRPSAPATEPAVVAAPTSADAAASLAPRQNRTQAAVLALALLLMLCSGGFWLLRGRSAAPVKADNPPGPSAVAVARADSSAAPTATATLAPSITLAPTATSAPTAAPAPSAFPTISVQAVEPRDLFVGRLPVSFMVRGANLEQMREARLMPDRGAPIPLLLESLGSDQVTLQLAALPESLNGAVASRLQLDGVTPEIPPITLRDYLAQLTVRGVKPDYAYTGRIFTDPLGSYTTLHGAADATTPALAPLRNGEQIEVLRDDTTGWYQARIRVSNDPAQVGKVGWVERWLIDDAGAPTPRTPAPAAGAPPQPIARPTPLPPTPRPAPPAPPRPAGRGFAAAVVRSYPGSGSSGARSSCVQGLVLNNAGRGVAAALVNVNNGSASVDVQTNGQGEYRICGLGDSTWSVVLRYIPNRPRVREVAATFYVNGSSEQVAVVNFSEQ